MKDKPLDQEERDAMALTLDLPPELEQTLRQQAARSNQDVTAFVLQAVQEKIARGQTFDDICAPFAAAVAATGMTDEEFDRFFEEAREEVWQEKQGKKP
jgi:predicted transcriptional regulator